MSNKLIFSIIVLILVFTFLFFFGKYYFLPNLRIALRETFEELLEEQNKKTAEKFDKEDERSRNKEKEKKLEKVQEKEVEVFKKQARIKQKPQVVGLNLKVFGKFTKKLVANFLNTVQGVDPETINEKGFYQAKELARRGEIGKSKNTGGREI